MRPRSAGFPAHRSGRLVRQAIDAMQPVAEAEDVHLATTPCRLHRGGPDRLLQVMTNLLSNAIKFSPPRSTVRMLRPRRHGRRYRQRGRRGPWRSRRQAGKPSSTASSRSMLRIRGRKAVPASVWRSAAPSSISMEAASGRSKTKAEAPSSGSSCPSALPFPRWPRRLHKASLSRNWGKRS